MGESEQDLGGTVVIPPAEEREQENGHGTVVREAGGEAEREQRERDLLAGAGARDPDLYLGALLRRREIELGRQQVDLAPVVPGVNWVPLGPSVIANSGGGRWQAVSGRVEDMVVGPSGARAYIASTWGGAWMTPDGGATWSPINDYVTVPSYALGGADVSSLTTGALAVRFGAMAGSDLVYVGTGAGTGGIGVLSSPSGGTPGTWTREATNLAGVSFNAITIDPDDPTVVLAATNRGIYRRPTAGSTAIWTQVSGTFTNPSGDALHLTVAGSGASRRYCAAFASDRVYTSSDGTTWTAVPGFTVHAYGIRLAIAESDTSVVYALNGDGTLYRLSNGSFRVVAGPPLSVLSPGGQLPYDMVLAVDPSNSGIVYIGADYTPAQGDMSFYRGTVTGGPTSFTFSYNPANNANPSVDPTWIGLGIHPDGHAIAFGLNAAGTAHNPSDLWVAGDGGVYRSSTPATKGSYAARNTGLADAIPRMLAQRPDTDAVLFTGSQDNGTLRTVGEQVWSWRVGGDGGGVAVNPANQYQVMREESDGFLAASGDGGTTWGLPVNFPPAGASGGPERGTTFPYTPLVTTPPGAAPAALFFATNRLWMTTNWGTSWVTLPSATNPYAGTPNFTLDTIDGNPILAIAAPSGTVVYAATRSTVRRYSLSGATWSKTDIAGPNLGTFYLIQDIAVEDATAGTFYAVLGSGNFAHVYYYDGTTWNVAMPTSVLNTGAYCGVVDPLNPLTLYVGTDVGVWKGVKANAATSSWTWSLFSNGLPEASVEDIAIHDRTRLLRALTSGRGVWEYPLDVASVPDPDIYMRVNSADTGRITAAGTRNAWVDGAPDPLQPGRTVHHWMSADIKVRRGSQMGLPPLTLPANQLDFAVNIGDITDSGGIEEADVSGTDLVFVEVHGRTATTVPAAQVSVLALTCDASAGLPALPTDYASRIRSQDTSNWLSYIGGGGQPTQDWYFLDSAAPYRTLPNALDARNPQVVSWSFDFGSLNLPNTHDHVCVATFATTTTTADQIPDLGLTSLDQITMRDRHVVHRNLHLLPAGTQRLKALVSQPHDPQFLLVDFHNPGDRDVRVDLIVDHGDQLAGQVTLHLPPLEALQVGREGLRGVVPLNPEKLGERAQAVHAVWNREVERLVRETEEEFPERGKLRLRPDSRTARRVRRVRRLARLDRGVLFACEKQRLCAVEGVALAPGASVTAVLAVSAPAKARIGDRFTFDVMQRRDGRIVGGSTYVLALARTPYDD
jgi:hypothetical protein